MRQLTLFLLRAKITSGLLRIVLPAAAGVHFAFWVIFFTKTYVSGLGIDAITSAIPTAVILTWYSIKLFWLETLALGAIGLAVLSLPAVSERMQN
ncbi:hypothetical protein [uncultured Pelagimonas sp.]|uniref:hypothetical protein n=1 Tax=uncultured Pelagimonas sp. TaxID=1618102 RepID=UPI002627A365|nr:hypothetical protein [uncultured Pelagimonas sp.]